MDAPPPSASGASASAVLTSPALWRLIVSFQRGLPMSLYAFWLAHEPSIANCVKDHDFLAHSPSRLTALLVEHGTIDQLESLSHVVFFYETMLGRWVGGVVDPVFEAIRLSRADVLEWAIRRGEKLHDHPISYWEDAVRDYKDGDVGVLDVLRKLVPVPPKKLERLFQQPKDVPLLRWVDQHFPGSWAPWIIQVAIEKADIELVAYLLEHHPQREYLPSTFGTAYRHRRYQVVRWLLEKRPDLATVHEICQMIHEGEPEAMSILREVSSVQVQTYVSEAAKTLSQWGDLDLVQRVLDERLLSADTTFSIDEVALEGKLEVIKLLSERGLSTATSDAMDNAAERGHWETVQYLHENRSDGCTTRAMDAAAKFGRLDIVKLFHEERSEGCTKRAMDYAASYGFLDVVRFLHENRTEGCTGDAMAGAVGNGFLSIVQFLQENRSEGCWINAMDYAAGQGHLQIVQYLHGKGTEGCTSDSITGALKGGYLHVVPFLFQHYRSVFGPERLHDLLLHGAFEIWTELRGEYPTEAEAVVEPVMLQAGEQMELATIQFIIQTLGRRDLAHLAMDGAAKYGYNKNAQLTRAVFKIAGPDSVRLSAVRNAAQAEKMGYPEDLQFLITVCCEDGAREVSIETARLNGRFQFIIADKIEAWQPRENEFEELPMHPLLEDARCPSWAIRSAEMNLALMTFGFTHDRFFRFERPVPWVILAINRGDQVLVELLRDLHVSSPDAVSLDSSLSMEGARAAAIRNSNLPLLQWLLKNVDSPVEPTLLDEALYYHEFQIAEWLAEHCQEGCRELDWDNKAYVPWCGPCGLDQELLDWIEHTASVKSVVDCGGLASHAAAQGDVEALRRLYATHPEAVLARGDLVERAEAKGHADAVAFLVETAPVL